MANGIKQQNNGFNSIYKGNFSIGINNISYGGTADTGFWNTIPATGSSTGDVIYTYLTKGSDGPSIYEMSTDNTEFMTAANQIKTSVDGPYITTSTFTTTRNITIPSSSTASTYPLEFNVSGINSSINFATLTLGILSGSNVQNLGIVLVAPDNTTFSLIKGSLSSPVATTGEISVNLSQYKGVFAPTFGSWDGYSAGNYNSSSTNGPTSLTFAAPCPIATFNTYQSYTNMGIFNGTSSGNTNGTWSLYIQDFGIGGETSTLVYADLSFTTNALEFGQEFLTWAESSDSVVLINRDYPSINTSGLQLHIDPWYLPSANANSTYNSLSAGQKVSDLTNNNNDATTTSGVSLGGTNYEYWGLNNPFTFDTVTNIPAGNSAYTVSLWFRTTSSSVGLLTFGTYTSSNANFFYIDGAGSAQNEWGGENIYSTGSTVNDNEWHNVTVTYNGTVAKMYIDGVLDNEKTLLNPLSVSPTSNLKIGEGIGALSVNYFSSGAFGPVMIYNRALSDNEVLTNYNSINDSHGY